MWGYSDMLNPGAQDFIQEHMKSLRGTHWSMMHSCMHVNMLGCLVCLHCCLSDSQRMLSLVWWPRGINGTPLSYCTPLDLSWGNYLPKGKRHSFLSVFELPLKNWCLTLRKLLTWADRVEQELVLMYSWCWSLLWGCSRCVEGLWSVWGG